MHRLLRQIIVVASLFLSCQELAAQLLTQTIRGRITDGDNNQPLAGVSVKIAATNLGTVTSEDGSFQISAIPIGRCALQISSLGYEAIFVPELLLEAGKEKVLTIALRQATKTLDEAVVTTARPVAISSVQSITNEQTMRYAATFLDPARLAASFAGVTAANDQANGLAIRGNSPNGLQWRLEGVEIVNPNHLSNAGTFSDRPSQTGGGTTILSAQLMERADFLTGAFPAEYGNALSGVMDVHLRKGNDKRHEFTGQAGLLGVDLSAEGPFSKKSKATYLVNYRYSFTGLLGALGVKFGGEDIRYQDLSFNFTFPTKRTGTFTVFGMGGLSSNNFTAQRDTLQWLVQKDGFDIDFKSKMGAVGLTHTVNLGKNTTWNTVVAASALESNREGYILSKTRDRRFQVEADSLMKARFSVASSLTHKLGMGWQLRGGFYLTRQIDDVSSRSPFLALGRAEGLIVQPYASVSGRILPRLSLQAGLHYLNYTYNKTSSLEPRAALRFDANARQSFSFSYGLHSQLQVPQLYTSIKNSDFRQNIRANTLLGLTRAHHLVLGYDYRWRKQSSLRLEAYYQAIFNVPIAKIPSVVSYRVMPAFSALNLEEQFVDAELANAGTGRNYGIEATYQRFLQRNYYLLITGSVYSATYVAQDGVRRSTRFDGGHTFSFTGGKEFSRKANRSLGVNLRVLWLGGFRDSPIDVEASDGGNRTVYKVTQLYSVKLRDYFRPDLRLYWKKNKPGFTRTWSIDVQNLTSTQNEANSYFDILQNKVVQRYQLGIIPVVSYRVEF